MKTAMTKVFPDLDRILIMDVDTITCDSLSALWDWDLTHAYYAAVIEPRGSSLRGKPYANFGIVMMNLAKLRESGFDDEIIAELNSKYHAFPEQDAFSKVCGHFFDPLPPDYNVTRPGFDITGNPSRTIVRHFAGFDKYDDFGIFQYWLHHTKPMPRYVVYAGNRRYYPMMETAAKSLLQHSPVDRIFFLIEDDTFPNKLPDIFTCINVSHQTVFPLTGPNIMSFYSYMTTLRAGLTKLLPSDIDRVLWLDPDTIVCDDISDIWNTDIFEYYFAAVEEVRNHNHTQLPYFNAGVMLMNLAKFREDGMDQQVIDAINTTKYEHLEQDALNFLCHKHIVRLPSFYSDSFVSAPCNNPKIKHFLATAKRFLPEAQRPYVNLGWNEIKYAQKGDHNYD